MLAEDWQHGGFGLYVHWPFCESKCPYCDFNSHVVASVDHKAWRDALVSEIWRYGRLLGRRPLTSVFFGGGTPSLMPEHTVEAVVQAATDAFAASNSLEVTLEANPSSVEADRFAGYRSAGVTRVSLGVQSLRGADLKALGRLHSADEALAALDVAQSTFSRVSFDLIYARQNQNVADWEAELTEAIALGTGHLSLYQLTIEPGTAFGARFAAGGLQGLPDENMGADLYELTNDMCEAAGLPAYETSNHARPDDVCTHNQIYWRCGDYAGVGPGAHGRLTLNGTRWATETHRQPGAWMEAVKRGNGEASFVKLAKCAHAEEIVMMGLRTAEGVSLSRLEAAGLVLTHDRLESLKDGGWIYISGDRLKTTRSGRPVLNAILRELLA